MACVASAVINTKFCLAWDILTLMYFAICYTNQNAVVVETVCISQCICVGFEDDVYDHSCVGSEEGST
jgi:hypothetical protein